MTEALRTVERNTELECRLQGAKPAHTHLVVGYVSVLPGLRFELPLHNEFASDRLRWEDTTDGLGDVSDLLATAGTEALSRVQINGNGGDGSNFIQLADPRRRGTERRVRRLRHGAHPSRPRDSTTW